MKRFIVIIALMLSWFAAQAQWSIGFDARLAPWGDTQRNMGTDLVVNYKFSLSKFYLMPTAGFFYQKYTKEENVLIDGYYPWSGPDNGPNIPPEKYGFGYRSGFDLACVIGKSFDVGAGEIAVFTGPRYAYAFAQHTGAEVNNAHLPNSLDWRVGLSYSIWKITASVKCDIGLLRQMKHPRTGGYDDKQVPVLGIGIAYNL